MHRVVRASALPLVLLTGAAVALVAWAAEKNPAAAVTAQRMLLAADDNSKEAGEWMSHGRTWGEQRFSPLKQINEKNVHKLGLAWYADLGTYQGVVATPLVIDGVLYNISAWDVTTAYDATNGKVLWTYDPLIPTTVGGVACCGNYSRGLAAWEGKLFIGALNAHLIALDAKTGRKLWETDTADPNQPLTITGAPRVTKDGLVVIGNSGGDLGARGFMSAYDANTGKQVWKFYIVPGDPKKPDGVASDSIMPMAAETWHGEWWKTGGGGNNWDAIVYDPELDLIYFGTGNGSPHPQAFRGDGGGDNLFIASIVAVEAKTGKYKWHYQEVPGDEWDYDSTSPLILADLKIDGQLRKAIMHAPKNGFFYVIDRATGKLISAQNFVPNTWASHVDLATGRPAVYPEARVEVVPRLVTPSAAHNWNPISYSPLTGLVYIPIQEQWMVVSRVEDGKFVFRLGRTTIGSGTGNFPELRRTFREKVNSGDQGYTLAWDPVKQKAAFRIDNPYEFQGGNLVTAGNLLVYGTMNNTLAIYSADKGHKLWESPTVSVPVAGPISYAVNGTQYIAVNAGWNNALVGGLNNPPKPFSTGPGKLLVFKLGAKGVELPPAPARNLLSAPPTAQQPDDKVIAGGALFAQFCSTCHGQNAVGSGPKDLRFIKPDSHAAFADIVLGGKYKDKGMIPFTGQLTAEQVDQIHSFIIDRGQQDWRGGFGPPAPPPPQR